MFDKHISLDNWVKDYNTGLYTSVSKLKPASLFKNRAHIQIRDSVSGRLKQEAVSENVVNNGINKFFNKKLLMDIDYGYAQPALQHIWSAKTNRFGKIILNNYTGAENADDTYFPNTQLYPTIGWAHKNEVYAGADTKRGTITLANCTSDYITGEIVKVFTWSGTKANGTFQSIFWVPELGDGLHGGSTVDTHNYLAIIGKFTSMSGNVFSGNGIFDASANYIYALTGKVYKVARPDSENYYLPLSSGHTELYDYTSDVTTPEEYDSVLTDGTNYYILCCADNKIYKYNSSWVYQSSFTFNYASYMQGKACIAMSTTRIWTTKEVSATETNIYEFDLSGNLLNTHNVYSDLGVQYSVKGIVFDGTNIVLMNTTLSGEIAIYDTSFNLLTYFKDLTTSVYYEDYACTYCAPLKAILCNVTSKVNAELYDWSSCGRPSAHTLLASPVTKSSGDTMTITYTFTFNYSDL